MNQLSEIEILKRSINDFLTKDILKLAFIPFLISVIILYILFFSTINNFIFDNTLVQIHQTQTTVVNNHIQTSTQSIISDSFIEAILNYILSSTITSSVIHFLVYTLGSVFIIIISIFISIIIIGFFTPKILQFLQQRYYQDIDLDGYGNFFSSILVTIKSILIMIILLIVLTPLYFIPIINIIAFNIPFFYMFHTVLTYDITSCMMNKEQYLQIKYKYKNEFILKSIFLYIISMIPFVGLFIPLFYVTYLGNSYFLKIKQ